MSEPHIYRRPDGQAEFYTADRVLMGWCNWRFDSHRTQIEYLPVAITKDGQPRYMQLYTNGETFIAEYDLADTSMGQHELKAGESISLAPSNVRFD